MLNEWSDRIPPGPRKPLLLTWYFWLGALVVLGSAAAVLRMALWLLGWPEP